MKLEIEEREPDEVQRFFSGPPEPPRNGFLKSFLMLLLLLAITFGMIALSRVFGGEVRLIWLPNNGPVTGYRIYRGIDLIATVADPAVVDGRITTKITLPDEPVTLGLVAYNSGGQSDAALLHLIPVTIETSPDLQNWTATRTIHRVRQSDEFFRLKIEKP